MTCRHKSPCPRGAHRVVGETDNKQGSGVCLMVISVMEKAKQGRAKETCEQEVGILILERFSGREHH